MRTRTIGIGAAATAMVVLTGCLNKVTEPLQDAPVSGRNGNPAEIYSMPDGFSNFASKCDGHGHRVFVAFHGNSNRAAITAIDDPSCN